MLGRILQNYKTVRFFISTMQKSYSTNQFLTVEKLRQKCTGSLHIKDPVRVHTLLAKICEGGKDKLQIISDFDCTITKTHDTDGNHCADTCGVIQETHEEFNSKTSAVADKYLKILEDPNMNAEEKIPHMIEWWNFSYSLLIDYKFSKEDFAPMVELSTATLRDGYQDLQKIVSENKVPFLILSAGLGDVIEEILKQQSNENRNETIVSNFLTFDSEGKASGFRGPLIHNYNKNQSHLHGSGYVERTKGLTNVLLLGDALTDIMMTDGLDVEAMTILKIGFLNKKSAINKKLQAYLDSFDIVLVDDQSMCVVNEIINMVVCKSK